MKSDLSRSAASSASLRSRSAVSMRKRSVTSAKVTRRGAVGQRRQAKRQDGAVVALDFAQIARRAARPRRWPGSAGPTSRRRRNLSAQAAAMARTCGSPRNSSALRSQMRAKAALCSFSLAVGTEHRDAFLQRVERRRLHLDQGVVVGFQRRAFR